MPNKKKLQKMGNYSSQPDTLDEVRVQSWFYEEDLVLSHVSILPGQTVEEWADSTLAPYFPPYPLAVYANGTLLAGHTLADASLENISVEPRFSFTMGLDYVLEDFEDQLKADFSPVRVELHNKGTYEMQFVLDLTRDQFGSVCPTPEETSCVGLIASKDKTFALRVVFRVVEAQT